MYNTFPYSLMADFFQPRTSVYVISDSQLAEYKERQLQAEIAELDRLIDDHKLSIERLEKTKASLTQTSSLSGSTQTSLQGSDETESKTVLG